MPIPYNQTRKGRAEALKKSLEEGPSFSATFMHMEGQEFTNEQKTFIETEMKRQFRLWSQSWVLPELSDLVPQLQAKG